MYKLQSDYGLQLWSGHAPSNIVPIHFWNVTDIFPSTVAVISHSDLVVMRESDHCAKLLQHIPKVLRGSEVLTLVAHPSVKCLIIPEPFSLSEPQEFCNCHLQVLILWANEGKVFKKPQEHPADFVKMKARGLQQHKSLTGTSGPLKWDFWPSQRWKDNANTGWMWWLLDLPRLKARVLWP